MREYARDIEDHGAIAKCPQCQGTGYCQIAWNPESDYREFFCPWCRIFFPYRIVGAFNEDLVRPHGSPPRQRR